ncbi:hypothetical protein AB0H18_41685 [Streptomyces sp. NPDC020766]|uniref:hypothetical protein n=1 Tax=Streptomyces sp. NPDC020766 TaxID=3155011 RepID=UPI0033EDDD41
MPGTADEPTNSQIAAACATGVDTVRKRRGRFALPGLPALPGSDDADRPGHPKLHGPKRASSSWPPPPARRRTEPTWSHRRIAGRLADFGISKSQGRLVRGLGRQEYDRSLAQAARCDARTLVAWASRGGPLPQE